MYKNKKADQWFWLISAIIAILILVVSIFFVRQGTANAKLNLDTFQNCESKKGGHCEASESTCKSDETAFYKALGCGNEKTKDKPYCCLPSIT